MKNVYRNDPKPGAVVRVALPEGRFGYLCSIDGCACWLYNFVSDYPIQDVKYFSKERWKIPCFVFYFVRETLDVCTIALTPEDERPIRTWTKAWQEDIDKGCAGPYKIHDPKANSARFGTEEDIKGIFQEIRVRGENLSKWIGDQSSELEMIHVPEEDRDPRINPPLADAEVDETRQFEITFPGNAPEIKYELGHIEHQFNYQLALIDAGYVIGTGYMEGGSADITLEVDSRRVKAVLRIIRNVVKRLKLPPETKISEYDPESEEPIIHSLENLPPKKRGK